RGDFGWGAAAHAADVRAAAAERQVHVRVRHDLLPVGLRVVPASLPVPLHPWRERRRRAVERGALIPGPRAPQLTNVPPHTAECMSPLFNTLRPAPPSVAAMSHLSSAAEAMAAVARTITDDQLANKTPCTEYDVRALVNHLLFWGPSLAGAGRKESVPPT